MLSCDSAYIHVYNVIICRGDSPGGSIRIHVHVCTFEGV